MKNISTMSVILAIIILAVPPRTHAQPDPEAVLETTRRVADKVLRETSFTYQLVPMTSNAGIMQVDIDGPVEKG